MEKYRKNYAQDASLIAQKHRRIAVKPVLITDKSNEQAREAISVALQKTIYNSIKDYVTRDCRIAEIQVLSITNDKIRILDQNAEDLNNKELASALDVDGLICMQLQLPLMIRKKVWVALKYYLYILLGWYNYVLTLQIYDRRTDKIIWRCEIEDLLPVFQKMKKIRGVVIQECCTMPYCRAKD